MTLTLEQAVDKIRNRVSPLDVEHMPLDIALGLALAEDILAWMNQPPFPRSPLDGYALRARDSAEASRENPVKLEVAYKLYAGGGSAVPVLPGQAVRLMTGSPIPADCDCVIRQEDTDEGEAVVQLYRELLPFENYVFAGEDFKAGDVLLERGARLDAAALAVAASAGYAALPVRRRPRVAVISTGDELTEPGKPLLPGRIYNSNLTYISTRLRDLGAQVEDTASAGDDMDELTAAFERAAGACDLIITTGGVSVGQRDLIPAVLDAMCAQTVFHGVDMKPGMPALYAICQGIPTLALSGNPFAAAVSFELLARPLLAAMQCDESVNIRRATAILQTDFTKGSLGRRFIRGRYADGGVTLPEGHSNGQIRSMVGCNCLVDVPPGSAALHVGDAVCIALL